MDNQFGKGLMGRGKKGGMVYSRRTLLTRVVAGAALALSGRAVAQKKKKDKKREKTRTVRGNVTGTDGQPIARAVVQIKNTRTLQVKSFITNSQGAYYFHGLDPNVDYQIQAKHSDEESRTRTVSRFDGRMELIYNFELKPEG